jgi:hypothetical protein
MTRTIKLVALHLVFGAAATTAFAPRIHKKCSSLSCLWGSRSSDDSNGETESLTPKSSPSPLADTILQLDNTLDSKAHLTSKEGNDKLSRLAERLKQLETKKYDREEAPVQSKSGIYQITSREQHK